MALPRNNNMAIRKICGSFYIDFQFNGKRYRKRSPVNTKGGAQHYEALVRQKVAKGEPVLHKNKKSIINFKTFAEKWFKTYVMNNNKISEVKGKRSILNKHLIPFFGSTKLDKFSIERIEIYKSKKLNSGLSAKTINNHLTVLNTALRTAKEWYELEKIPSIKKLKTPPPQIDFLTEEESIRLLKSADGMWYLVILTALRTGLRLGELRGLRWEDIDWETRQLNVIRSIYKKDNIGPPKSNKQRHIPLTSDLYSELYQVREIKGYVFKYRKKHLKNDLCRNELFRICDKAGLRKISWHPLRHSFASHLAMKGAPMISIKELMGHSDIQTTMRYSHLTPNALQDAVNLLDDKSFRLYGVKNSESKLNNTPNLSLVFPKKTQKPA